MAKPTNTNSTTDARRSRTILLVLLAGSLAYQFGFSVYRGVWNNFLYEVHGIQANQLGLIESLREVPGLLVAFLAALVAGFAPSVVGGAACLLMGAGLLLYPAAHGFLGLILITVLFSTGFHMLFPPQNTLVLYHAAKGEKGSWLGWMDSVGSLASVLAMVAVAGLVGRWGFTGMFYLAAAVSVAAAFVIFLTPGPKRLTTSLKPINIKREYVTYYVMTLLQGARRHFFLVFAVYNLVTHGLPTATIAILQGLGYGASVVTRPTLGRLADRYGETRVLKWCYAATGVVFLGYAFLHQVWVLSVLYVLDNILNFELIITLYANSVVPESEVASALSGGSTIGHIPAVFVPVLGGVVWKYAGSTVTFLGGVAICLVGFLYALYLGRAIARLRVARNGAGVTGSTGARAGA